jgi:PAS domain S-box-containing protein
VGEVEQQKGAYQTVDFRAVFEALPEPHLLLSRDFVMLEANQSRLNATGLSRAETLGRKIFDVFPDNPADPGATGVANLKTSLEQVLRTRKPHTMDIQKYDIPDAEGGFEERYWLPINTPVLSDSGEVLWIMHRVEDVTAVVRREDAAGSAAAGQESIIAKLRTSNQALAAEVAERQRAEEALQGSQEWLRLLLDTAADGVYAVDRTGATILCNAAFCSMLGFAGEEAALGLKIHDLIHSVRPDGSFFPHSECAIYKAAQTGEPAHVAGETFQRLDGSSFPVEYWARPIIRNGELQGAVCTFIDVTERHQAYELQELLVRELDHRVKNLFSIVTAIVALSARSAGSVAEMADDIKGRVLSLATAHELARPQGGTPSGSTGLEALATKVLAPHNDAEGRVAISGPAVQLTSLQATGLALVLHELGTNAVKYGGLSDPGGSVAVEWEVSSGQLVLRWVEQGGPAVTDPPARQGFGTVLASKTATSTLGGEITYDWAPEGLSVRLSLPLAS